MPTSYAMPSNRLVIKAFQAGITLFSLSFILFAYKRALIPIYGSGPTSFLFNQVVLVAFLASGAYPTSAPVSYYLFYAAFILTLAPNTTYWVAVWTARLKHPILGPALTHVAAIAPLVFLSGLFVTRLVLPYVDRTAFKRAFSLRLCVTGMSYMMTNLFNPPWYVVPIVRRWSESQIFLGIAGVLYSLSLLTYPAPLVDESKPGKRKIPKKSQLMTAKQTRLALVTIFAAFWWSIQNKLANPVLPHPLPEVFTHPSAPLQIYSSVQSVTGLIVVGEVLPETTDNGVPSNISSARYLRASHSILGGVWTRNKVHTLDDKSPSVDSFGAPLGDSIYAAFVLQEAIRLINSTETGRQGAWNDALVIGLGIGVSASSLIRHGISTSIVEIDPAVYDAARIYFGLPDPGPNKVFLTDARQWVADKRSRLETGNQEVLFDIVIHDCFSGGGVPQHIYTIEFWEDLKTIMNKDGVLVVNFAGVIVSESTRLVLYTLEQSFGYCRAFHDSFQDISNEAYHSDFINMVFFCTLSPGRISFRKPVYADYLGSPLRKYVFENFENREVNLDLVKSSSNLDKARYILTDAHNPLGKLQEAQGHHHWEVMRQVLPDIHWETY